MRACVNIFLLFHAVHTDATSLPTTPCEAGTFFDDVRGQCQACPDDHYMTEEMVKEGRQKYCRWCEHPDEPAHQVELEKCTNTKDTVIGCKEGYYKKKVSSYNNSINYNLNFECTACGMCNIGKNRGLPFELVQCDNDTNTVCCQYENMIVANGACFLSPTTSDHSNNQQQNYSNLSANGSMVLVIFLLCSYVFTSYGLI